MDLNITAQKTLEWKAVGDGYCLSQHDKTIVLVQRYINFFISTSI